MWKDDHACHPRPRTGKRSEERSLPIPGRRSKDDALVPAYCQIGNAPAPLGRRTPQLQPSGRKLRSERTVLTKRATETKLSSEFIDATFRRRPPSEFSLP